MSFSNKSEHLITKRHALTLFNLRVIMHVITLSAGYAGFRYFEKTGKSETNNNA